MQARLQIAERECFIQSTKELCAWALFKRQPKLMVFGAAEQPCKRVQCNRRMSECRGKFILTLLSEKEENKVSACLQIVNERSQW